MTIAGHGACGRHGGRRSGIDVDLTRLHYALDEHEKKGVLDRIAAEKKRGTPVVQRFKGLGEMNAMQLRETTMDPTTRRLIRLTLDAPDETQEVMDMLLAKKRAPDRREWLEKKGDQASLA